MLAPGSPWWCAAAVSIADDAVLHVEVGLLLPPVAEHAQARRVAPQRAVEVEHVPVRVALAEDRDEAKDYSGEAVARGVGGDQPLAGELGRRVERGLHRERARPRASGTPPARRRPSRWRRTTMRETPRLRIASSTSRGGDRVLLEVAPRVVEAVAHVRVGLQVEDPVAALHRLLEHARRRARRPRSRWRPGARAGRRRTRGVRSGSRRPRPPRRPARSGDRPGCCR